MKLQKYAKHVQPHLVLLLSFLVVLDCVFVTNNDVKSNQGTNPNTYMYYYNKMADGIRPKKKINVLSQVEFLDIWIGWFDFFFLIVV